MQEIRYDVSLWGEMDSYLFKEGTHRHIYEILGSHRVSKNQLDGVYFAVWAPNAKLISVIGDFNNYRAGIHPLKLRGDGSGVWEGFIPNLSEGLTYKYHITTFDDRTLEKSDPVGFMFEVSPKSATIIYDIDGYKWNDKEWMKNRGSRNHHLKPINIYEVHLGSWKRREDEGNRYLTYVELAKELSDYLTEMNYTHIEIMPITEYPFDGSWGYQSTGYFAPTSRFGSPFEFMQFIDILHQNGIGVIMDWVPSHFVTDGHGLAGFDGTALYEHKDPKKGYHPEWKSAIFNYGRNEVKEFLISSAMFWFKYYHIDGIRVDAVASMLYLDYAREDGKWIPNRFGGNENLEAISFLKELNESIYRENRGVMMIAEEFTAFPMVTKPTYIGGLGFGYKWNMGWMHDTLKYFGLDPVYRERHHHQLTFSFVYMYQENYILPLSHDEVVHLKNSIIGKMSGDDNLKFANIRALYSYMMVHPGKKLMFMGNEFAQWSEWDYKNSLEWDLLNNKANKAIQNLVKELNYLYKNEHALYQYDCEPKGFEWIDELDYKQNVISFLRHSDNSSILVVCHFGNIQRENYRVGVPEDGEYIEIFNSDDRKFGGNGSLIGGVISEKGDVQGRDYYISITLPPVSVMIFRIKS